MRGLVIPMARERQIVVVDSPRPASILAVAAHPDVIESWCDGTLARAIDQGNDVRLLLVTSGDKGKSDPTCAPAAVAIQREAEAQAVGATLGIAEMAFLRYPAGEAEDAYDLHRSVARSGNDVAGDIRSEREQLAGSRSLSTFSQRTVLLAVVCQEHALPDRW